MICDLAAKAAQGLSAGNGAAIVNSVANVLGVLGAADIGIQLGTGGQAGLLDLPGLANTAGIECTDPDTGEVTYVTPLQWYGNGMSCSGLKNPDQERIKKELETFQKKQEINSKLRSLQGMNATIPTDTLPTDTNELEKIAKEIEKLGKSKNSGMTFDYPGMLSALVFSIDHFRLGGMDETTKVNYSYQKPVNKGEKLIRVEESVRGRSGKDFGAPTYGYSSWTQVAGSSFKKGQSGGVEGWNAIYLEASAFWFNVDKNSANYSFVPSFTPSPGAYIVTEIGGGTNIRPRDPTTPCDNGGKPSQPMPCSQCKLTPEIIKMIRETYGAVGAQRLMSGVPFNPEKEVENWGRTLYQSAGGAGVKCSTLIDIATATAAAPYYRMGLQRFPALVPKSLVNKSPLPNMANDIANLRNVTDLASFLEWFFLAFEEILGEWPIKFEVTDDGKSKPVDLWNISEALAEIYGMNVKIVEDSDQGVQWGVRAATEASKSGNAAVKALHLLTEIADFLGAIKSQGTLEIDCTFTPNPSVGQTTEEMLSPSKQTLFVTNIQDGRSVLGLLLNINYWSQIAGRANFQTLKTNPATGQMQLPGDVIKQAKKDKKIFGKKFDEWRKKRQQPNTAIPNDQKPKGVGIPDIKVIEVPDNKL